MTSGIVIRDVEGPEEIRAIEDLQKEVWGLDDRDITPLTQLVAVKESGGQLIGAYDGRTLIGFVYGFLGLEQGKSVHHSHMLAVKPEYRHHDVGFGLKVAQRKRVLEQGITRIVWTFDPLQSLNAHFNFCKLGVLSAEYKIDFYGSETSSFLHRIGTDRLWVTWLLNSSRVRCRLDGKRKCQELQQQKAPLVEVGPDGSPRQSDLQAVMEGLYAFIEIPGDINAIQQQNPAVALEWRESTRRAFSEALLSGFIVEDFFRRSRGDQTVGVYMLSRGRTIEDFA